MKHLLFFLTYMIITACQSDDNNEQFIVDTAINIAVKDNDGNDLLNPNNSNALNQNEFQIIYEIDGKQTVVNDKNLNYPNGFFVYPHEKEYRIRIFPNTTKNSSNPITYVKWNKTDTDTIRCEINRSGNTEVCKKVWLNNKLVWEAYDTERFFEIIK
ncbi:hypothetical protein [Empedobacter brevis]|nr:hypothetical protein [Empedobacter brevis]